MEEILKPYEKFLSKTKTHEDPLLNLDIGLVTEYYGKKKFNELMSIVNKHDPFGLMGLAPISEYDLEVASIIVQIFNLTTIEEIHTLVNTEFERWFGEMKELDILKEMSEDIYDWKHQEGTRNLYDEYISTAQMYLRDKIKTSDYGALFFFKNALLVHEGNIELEKSVNELGYRLDQQSETADENESVEKLPYESASILDEEFRHKMNTIIR